MEEGMFYRYDLIPKKQHIPELSEQPNAEWVFFTLGLRFGSMNDKSKLEIFGLNPETCKVYHVIDFQLSDYSDFDDDFCEAGELPEDIAFAARGTELFIVVGLTASFYTCDISGPMPHKWEKGPGLNFCKDKPLLFAVRQKLYVLSRRDSCAGCHIAFEKLDLSIRRSWEELPYPPFLGTLSPTKIYCAIDQEDQKIYVPTPDRCVRADICVFDCLESKWWEIYFDSDRLESKWWKISCDSESESESEDNFALIFNLCQIPPWDGFAPILYGKIYLIQKRKLCAEPQLNCLRPALSIIAYNLNARPPLPLPKSTLLEDLMYMTPKRITGLHEYFTNPWDIDYQTGAVVPLGTGGRICYVAFFSDGSDTFISSMQAAVVNLRLDHIENDFPDEVEEVTLMEIWVKPPDSPKVKVIVRKSKYSEKATVRKRKYSEEKVAEDHDDMVIDEPVLRPQGAVVESFYEFGHEYLEFQVGSNFSL